MLPLTHWGRDKMADIFQTTFSNAYSCLIMYIWIKISLKFVPKVRINNIPALVQIMAWCRIGHKPLSEPMMVNLLAHICVTRPQWVNSQQEHPYFSYYMYIVDLTGAYDLATFEPKYKTILSTKSFQISPANYWPFCSGHFPLGRKIPCHRVSLECAKLTLIWCSFQLEVY